MRKIKLMENTDYTPCPKCGNNREFTAYSAQVAEDGCDVWVVCKCGYDPTAGEIGSRYEDVWGGTDNGNVVMALECWNDAIREAKP